MKAVAGKELPRSNTWLLLARDFFVRRRGIEGKETERDTLQIRLQPLDPRLECAFTRCVGGTEVSVGVGVVFLR